MMKKLMHFFMLVGLALLVQACQKSSHQDIKDFIDEAKRKQPGKVKAPPVYAPYKPYIYNAAQLRSPFEPPAVVQKREIAAKSNVKPDLNRQKQRLENYDFASLSMVGTIKRRNVLWALIRDPDGSIERVREGYYVGRNHGKIVSVDDQKIDVVEIVPNGVSVWLERPNLISIKQKD